MSNRPLFNSEIHHITSKPTLYEQFQSQINTILEMTNLTTISFKEYLKMNQRWNAQMFQEGNQINVRCNRTLDASV